VIHRAARSAGRDPARITAGLQVYYVTAPTEAEARQIAESRAIRFLTLLAPAEVWERAGAVHPLGQHFRGMVDFVPYRYGREELEDALAAASLDVFSSVALLGPPGQIVDRVRALGEAGLDHAVLVPASALVSRRAALYALRSLPGIVRALRSGS
jgi:phthiodiolone/phenolphthiodiolone dimycocerosates ketoreductase